MLDWNFQGLPLIYYCAIVFKFSELTLMLTVQIHTRFHCFMEIGLIFHDKYNAFFQKKQVQVENERWNNSLICRASLEGNGSGQYPVWMTQKHRKGKGD